MINTILDVSLDSHRKIIPSTGTSLSLSLSLFSDILTHITIPNSFSSSSPYPSPSSLPTLLINNVIPRIILSNHTRFNHSGIPALVIANTDGIRFDMYQGEFTRDDEFMINPFPDRFMFVGGVKVEVGRKVSEIFFAFFFFFDSRLVLVLTVGSVYTGPRRNE
jgi:hypothetical protein